MDENQDTGAWAMSRLGFAIDSYVDRQLNNPQVIGDHSAAYGMDQNGNLYRVGQPTTVQTMAPVGGSGRMNPTLLLLVLAGVFMAMHK